MRAEVPTPSPDKQGSSSLTRSRRQVILFAVLTFVLTVATVWGGRIWLKNSETLTFAVGEASGPEARFAAMFETTSSRLRLGLRDETGVRRESLKRQGGHDDNVVIVKPAQST